MTCFPVAQETEPRTYRCFDAVPLFGTAKAPQSVPPPGAAPALPEFVATTGVVDTTPLGAVAMPGTPDVLAGVGVTTAELLAIEDAVPAA